MNTNTDSWAGIAALLGGFIGFILAVLVFVFSLWMLIDCIKNERDGTQRVIWAVAIFFLPCVGSLVYFFVRKASRRG